MVILGIHYGHDSNVSLIKNGKCIYAISEERISKIKFDNKWPEQSLSWILNNHDIKKEPISAIAIVGARRLEETSGGSLERIYEKFNLKKPFLLKLFSKIINIFDNSFPFFSIRSSFVKKLIKKKLSKYNVLDDKIFFLDHHFCHAIGAFYASGFSEDTLIVTCDGKGDGYSHKNFFGRVDNNGLKEVELISSTKDYDSIGFFYSTVTEFLGFKRMRHEGKVTGLAAHGKLNKSINSPVSLKNDGLSLKNELIKDHCESKIKLFKEFIKLDFKLFFKILINNAALEGRYAQHKILKFLNKNLIGLSREDIAFYAQNVLETNLVKLINNFISKYKSNNLCLSGGVFANVKLNQKILESSKKNVFVMPAMDDGGLSLGASLYVYEKVSNKKIDEKFENIYFGPGYNNSEIEKVLINSKLNYKWYENIEEIIAIELSKEKIVGRFNERMEWGPRALGNRSILVSAKNKSINDDLNKRLDRSEFMPFAPIIIFEDAKEYFENFKKNLKSLEFMTMTLNVNKAKVVNCPAVVHVDNTARPQCVKSDVNKSLYKILKEYKKITNIPVLINTSFNIHEEPIICSPEDAVRSFNKGAIDVLAIGNFIVTNE